MLYIRSPSLFALSTWQFLAFFAWFIVEIVTHSYSDIIDVGTGQQPLPLAEQSLQLFMYTTLLVLASLCAQWYADFTRTRASRHMALAVSTFTTFAWLWNLWFVIPAFRRDNEANWYCAGPLTTLSRWCNLFQASASLAVCMEFGMFLTWLWSLFYLLTLRTPEIPIPTQATILAPHHSLVAASESGAHNADVAWNTELTEPDDLEQMKIAANNPQTHAPIVNRLSVLGHVTSFFSGLSLIGWIVLTCALIDVARYTGLGAWSTQDRPGVFDANLPADQQQQDAYNGTNRLGDPVVAANWYWLTITLGVSIAVSSYSSFRRNRAVIGGAGLLSFLSALQWFSLFIYMARRVHQQSGDPNFAISVFNQKHSQYVEVAGAGLIAVSEILRSFVLFFRYMTYMLVTKLDHDRVHIPSHVDAPTVVQAERDNYNPNYANAYGGTNTANIQDYTSAHQNHAHRPTREMNVPGPSYDAGDHDLYVPSYNMGIFHGSSALFRLIFAFQVLTVATFFVLQIVYQSSFGLFNNYQAEGPERTNANDYSFTGNEAPDRAYYYNEYMFLLSTILVLGAWIPAFHAEREVSVSSAVAACYSTMLMCLGFFLLIWTFAYNSIYSSGTLYEQVCINASGRWCSMTQAGGILALINAFGILLVFLHSMGRLAERRLLITTWESTVQNVPGLLAPLIVIGICIWSFTQLYLGLFTVGVTHQFQDNAGMTQNNPIESYFASQAFLTFAACSLAVWVGVYSSKLLYAWQSWSWRMAAFFTSMVAAAFTVPLLIYASRFIYNGGLDHPDESLAAALIILCGGATFYFASFLFLIHTAFYAAGPAGAAIPPTGMALKQNQQFIANKNEHGTAVQRDLEMGTVTGVSQYEKNTTVVQSAEPVVNPRTGETVVAVEQHPVAEQTTVTHQPMGLAAPANNVVYTSGPQTVQYHDY